MGFETLKPPAPLADLVESIWDWQAPQLAHRFERMLPVTNAGLIINLAEDQTRVYDDVPGLPCRRFAGAAIDAPRHRSFVIDTAEQVAVMGVVFRCGGAAPFFRERMDVLANEHVDLADIVGARAAGLRERLLEAGGAAARIALLHRWLLGIAGAATVPAMIAMTAARLQRAPSITRIANICNETGLSPRRFGTLFREHVGMSPKRYARLQRFRAVVASARRDGRVEWSRVAADCGFYDQPHLVREFRAFAGMTPSAYLASCGAHANHVPLTGI